MDCPRGTTAGELCRQHPSLLPDHAYCLHSAEPGAVYDAWAVWKYFRATHSCYCSGPCPPASLLERLRRLLYHLGCRGVAAGLGSWPAGLLAQVR